MIEKSYEYYGYLIEIHQHPIYHDFEFVIKTKDGSKVISTSNHFYDYFQDAENEAKLIVNNL